MRKILVLGGVLMLAACGGNPSMPPTVSWGYGTGNGDPVTSTDTTKYSFANGLGQDVPVVAGQMPVVSRAYGADETHGAMEQMSPVPQNTNFASPAPTTTHPAITPAPSSHL